MGTELFSDELPLSDAEIRERASRALYAEVKDLLEQDATEKAAGKRGRDSGQMGRAILDAATEIVFRSVLREGYFRFPNGYGSLKVTRLTRSPRPKRLPTGQVVQLPAHRVRMRYEEGSAVREALGMPPSTPFRRRFARESVLHERATKILDSEPEPVA